MERRAPVSGRTEVAAMNEITERRIQYKKERRLKNIKLLVDRLGVRVLRGEESLRDIEMILERVSQQGYYPQIIDAIRRPN